MPGAKESIVADAVKARGQDVEQKAADEFAGGECQRLWHRRLRRVGSIVLVGEPHLPVVDVEQAIIGERHAMGVTTDVVEDLLRTGEQRQRILPIVTEKKLSSITRIIL
jgi:hypothetical protein